VISFGAFDTESDTSFSSSSILAGALLGMAQQIGYTFSSDQRSSGEFFIGTDIFVQHVPAVCRSQCSAVAKLVFAGSRGLHVRGITGVDSTPYSWAFTRASEFVVVFFHKL
jgi:hypothetical protein